MAATLQLTAKEDVTKTLFKLEQQNLRLIEQNKKLAGASRRATGEAKRGLKGVAVSSEGVVGSLTRMAAGYLSVQSGIMAVTSAMKDLEEQQRRSRDATITQSDAQRNMLRNLGNVTDEQQDRFLANLQNITARTAPRGGLATVYNMAATGLSASGANRKKTLEAVAMALEFAPEDPATATSIVGALLHMGKATGQTDMRENLGFLKLAGEQAAITDWEKIATNMSPAIIGATTFGATPQEGLALVAAMTQASADPTGKQSGTASIKLAQQLEAFLPTEDIYGQIALPGRKRKTRGVVTKGTGLKTLGERIEYIQTHPLKRERFLETLTLEAKQLGPAIQLMQGPETMAGKAYSSALAAADIPFEKMAKSAGTKIDQMNRQFEQQIAEGKRGTEIRGELASTQTPSGRTRSIQASFTADELDKMLADRGVDWLRRKTEVIGYRIAQPIMGSEQAFSDAARNVARRYRFKGESETAESIEADLSKRISRAESQRTEAKRLDEKLDKLNDTMEKVEHNTRRTGEGTDQIEKNTRGPAPVAVQENVTQHGEK